MDSDPDPEHWLVQYPGNTFLESAFFESCQSTFICFQPGQAKVVPVPTPLGTVVYFVYTLIPRWLSNADCCGQETNK
jgi:hypothetical protein